MKIIFFVHPDFLNSQSMPRFANMLIDGMRKRGHFVQVWKPNPFFYKISFPAKFKKWLGYIDQYILFPILVRIRIWTFPGNALYVFCDQAMGPWVPLVKNFPHVIHCHDFLAQRSALKEIPENPISRTGKIYQAYIKKGYKIGKNFISVSKKTQSDLGNFMEEKIFISNMVYNGLNPIFKPGNKCQERILLSIHLGIDLNNGFLLHVGGNQWYKNRAGVIELYNYWRAESRHKLPLLMIGPQPNSNLINNYLKSKFKDDIHFLTGKNDFFVRQAYIAAKLFLFPSLDEGFGWPIAEAMASGCPVVTTGELPMTEVGGSAANYISRMPINKEVFKTWAKESAKTIENVVNMNDEELKHQVEIGLNNVKRFDSDLSLNKIEKIYYKILSTSQS
ncbi:glycosyltransferase [Cyclobacterium salsum]|uniref:glycosyltransferase n=1 Tax=Cyclobacterium salsum TaxID=2666329 RepID=UPI00139183A6|nr:glycosyltransferase [Cyclobacterium salsum]